MERVRANHQINKAEGRRYGIGEVKIPCTGSGCPLVSANIGLIVGAEIGAFWANQNPNWPTPLGYGRVPVRIVVVSSAGAGFRAIQVGCSRLEESRTPSCEWPKADIGSVDQLSRRIDCNAGLIECQQLLRTWYRRQGTGKICTTTSAFSVPTVSGLRVSPRIGERLRIVRISQKPIEPSLEVPSATDHQVASVNSSPRDKIHAGIGFGHDEPDFRRSASGLCVEL